jgi:hypothetical protein
MENKEMQAQSWIDAIFSTFSVVEAPKKRRIVEITSLVNGLPKTIGQGMSISSAAVLSNFGQAFRYVVKGESHERQSDARG